MNANQPQNRSQRVNINELIEKVQSKKELYNFLIQDCEAYLPKLDTVNIFFLKAITRGSKDVSVSSHYLDSM